MPSLESGRRLGPYEIVSAAGAGGMGEVYKAKDTRLDRMVAIKVLPAHLAGVPDFRKRFEQEARAVSSLNHRHICTLHDLGCEDDVDFLVMEFLEGETLAERLKRGALPLAQALVYARQIADALDKAHRGGIVHRDLKPGNVMLTKEGVKLLDFGLAKLHTRGIDPALSSLPTQNQPLTREGSIVGTLHYMAPEQLEAKEVDARADLFSLGAVLYEMVTGRRAFTGESPASIITSIMSATPPPMTELVPLTPTSLERLVAACLTKDRDSRWQSAGDLARELSWVTEEKVGLGSPRPERRRRLGILVAISTVVLLAVGLAARLLSIRPPESPVTVRFAFSAAPAQDLGTTPGRNLALSPDGNTLVYSTADGTGTTRLFRRAVDDLEQLPIAGTEGAANPFFSYDGREIGFVVGNQLKKIPIGGGTATVVTDIDEFRGASWGPNGIVLSTNGNLVLVPREGGAPVSLAPGDSVRGFWPIVLGGGSAVVYSSFGIADGPLKAATLTTGRLSGLIELGVSGNVPLGVVGGHLIFSRSDGQLFAVPFDADQMRFTGSARAIESEAARNSGNGETKAAVSGNGTLAYATGSGLVQAVVVDLRGVERALPVPPGRLHFPRFSPDGRRFAADLSSNGRTDIYVYDVESGAVQRLTAEGTVNERPEWSRDGQRILYKADRAGANATLWWQPADGTGTAELLVASAGRDIWQGGLSPDGKTVLYRTGGGGTGDIWYAPVGGGSEETALAATRFNELGPRFSPDGRWVAYYSNESGSNQIYVRPFPGPGAAVPVSVSGGRDPVWSPDGRKIYFVTGRKLMAASVVTTPSFSVTRRDTVFDRDLVSGGGHAGYDVAPDGKSFLMLVPASVEAERIVVVRNSAAELRAGSARASTQ